MAVHNFVGDSFRGATWVALHNGGGTGEVFHFERHLNEMQAGVKLLMVDLDLFWMVLLRLKIEPDKCT